MTAALLLSLSPAVAGHLAVAIDGHRRWAARAGMLLLSLGGREVAGRRWY